MNSEVCITNITDTAESATLLRVIPSYSTVTIIVRLLHMSDDKLNLR